MGEAGAGIAALVFDVCGVLKRFDQVLALHPSLPLAELPPSAWFLYSRLFKIFGPPSSLAHRDSQTQRLFSMGLTFVAHVQVGRPFALPQLPEELQEEFALVGESLRL